MPWPVSVLLALVFLASYTVKSQEAHCGVSEEEEVVLLQTLQMRHQRREYEEQQEEQAGSIERAKQTLAEDARTLRGLMEQEVTLQGSSTFSNGMGEISPAAKNLQHVSQDGLVSTEVVAQKVTAETDTADEASLRAQLQEVAKQRDQALEQAEESTEALHVVQEEMRIALLQATTPEPTVISNVQLAPVAVPAPSLTPAASAAAATLVSVAVPAQPAPAAQAVPRVAVSVTTTTQAPANLATFDGEVSAPVGILIWVLFATAILCCGSVCAAVAYGAFQQNKKHSGGFDYGGNGSGSQPQYGAGYGQKSAGGAERSARHEAKVQPGEVDLRHDEFLTKSVQEAGRPPGRY